jgi:MbtH protein
MDLNDVMSGSGSYVVLVNGRDGYCILAADAEITAGWSATGYGGSQADCFAYIDRVWDDSAVGQAG